MDEENDLAILQVSAPDVQPLPLGDSNAVEIGDTVYVAGNPKDILRAHSRMELSARFEGIFY